MVVMEDLFGRFRSWLAKSQMQLASLEPSPEDENSEATLKEAQVQVVSLIPQCISVYLKTFL